MKNTITSAHIDALIAASQVEVSTRFGKVTVVSIRLPHGFVITEAAGAVDPANYSLEIGTKVCMDRIKNKLWELEGYKLSAELNLPGNPQ